MSFDVAAESYGRFMGRFSEPLADEFVALTDLHNGQRALDVGCGPGALTERLVARLGAGAVSAVDPEALDESGLAGSREGHLAELFAAAGLRDVESSALTVRVGFATFADWWEPFTLGVGPAGAYTVGLDDAAREALRERCRDVLPPEPFEVGATAWCAVGRA